MNISLAPADMKRPIPAALLAGLPDSTWLGCSNRDISKAFSLPASLVKAYRTLNEKPKAPRKPGSGRPRKVAWTDIQADQTVKQNAERLGVSRQHIYHIKKQLKGTK